MSDADDVLEALSEQAEPEPDLVPPRDPTVAGRLVQPDEGVGMYDDEPEEIASAPGDSEDLSAEEAAVHVIDEPG